MKCEVSPWVRARRLKSLIRHPMLPVYRIEGEANGGRLSVLLADDGAMLGYFRQLAFPGGSTLTREGSISAFKAPQLAQSEADLVVVGANHMLLRRYAGRGFHLAPRFVRLRLFVYDDPDTMIDKLRGSAREDLKRNVRRMKEKDFTCEITQDGKWFDQFYHQMYRPYAENRHGDLARVHDYRAIRRVFRRGVGISITRAAEPVAGALAYVDDGVMFNPCAGVLGGDLVLAREGVSVALYYYAVEVAHPMGCKMADFGYSPPFVSDGALAYKLKWGMGVVNCDDSLGLYAIAAPGQTEAAMDFLKANRYYHLTENGLELRDEF